MREIWQQLERFYPRHALLGEIFLPDISLVPFDTLKPYYVPFNFSLEALQTLDASQSIHKDYFVFGLSGSSTGSFQVSIKDAKTRQPHQAIPVVSHDILGTGQRPMFLRRPYYVSPASAINVRVVDTSGAANNVTVTVLGAVRE